MAAAKFPCLELGDFLSSYSGAEEFPLATTGSVGSMLLGFQMVDKDGWVIGQLDKPIPGHAPMRAVHLLDKDPVGNLYLTKEGNFILVNGSGLSQISQLEAVDNFGALAIARALSNRVLEQIDEYLQVGQLWQDTLDQVKQKLSSN